MAGILCRFWPQVRVMKMGLTDIAFLALSDDPERVPIAHPLGLAALSIRETVSDVEFLQDTH